MYNPQDSLTDRLALTRIGRWLRAPNVMTLGKKVMRTPSITEAMPRWAAEMKPVIERATVVRKAFCRVFSASDDSRSL